MKPNRREFTLLGTSTLLSSITTPMLGQLSAQTSAPNDSAKRTGSQDDVPWYMRVRRTGQTNFNERDPQNADVEGWADYWASAKVEAVALSISTLVAFYPTDVPFFPRSPYLNGRDLFGECVAAAKKRGLRIYGRMSPDVHKEDDAVLAAHPQWFRRDRSGNLQHAAPGVLYTCQFGGSFTELQPAIMREVMSRYEIDGLYMNGWPTEQSCWCENCRKIGEPRSPEYRAALLHGAIELIGTYTQIATDKHPDNFYSCNLGGGLMESGLDQWELTRGALWYTADNQAREGVVAPVWGDAQQVKVARASMPYHPVAAVTASYSRSGHYMWRNVTGETAEAECRMAQTSATGGVIWYHHLGMEQGFKEDRRWQKLGREFLGWHAKHDRHFHNVRSMAKVAIIAAPHSNSTYPAPANEPVTDAVEGFYATLLEARIPFEFMHERDLWKGRLDLYDMVILPNVACLSNEQAQALRDYASAGGSLIATFETGLYDEAGKARADFALGEVFGIKKSGPREKAQLATSGQSMLPVYLQSLRTKHALNAGFDDTTWIAGPIWRVPLAPVADAPMTFINAYPGYPTETVYQREPPTDLPTIVAREQGASRFCYLAGDTDASFYRLDNGDLARQMLNAVNWTLNGKAGVNIAGDGLMEVTAWETEPGFALHMVNYNGPNAYRGKMRKLLPLGPQTVRMELPRDVRIQRASLLRAEKPLPFRQNGRIVEFTVPSVGAYEVAALEAR
ncbi:MAG TPA: alpha-amylase family protein [Acidobacteriaceae bacterium]|nr:alpha-amylase family protein [Acidobacteriaceae bacterium]